MLAFAEYERGMIVERTQTGKAVARQNPNFREGRPKKYTATQLKHAMELLDAEVTKRGTAVSLVHGILYSLILGLGMSCCMVWAGVWFVPGILIGCIGLAGVATAYPVYNHIVKQDREKISPEILRLSEELMHGT